MSDGVPLLDLAAHIGPIRDEIRGAVDRVIDSAHFIMGPEVDAFEREMAAYCRCSHAISVSSGTDAILLSLMELGLAPGDEVVTTPYSFFATSGSIARLGATPIYVDVDPVSLNIDPSGLDRAFSSRTKAVLPVHLFGQMAEMGPILDAAGSRGVVVIEDAAQAIGAEWSGRRAGSLGAFGCFSFFPSKNLGGFGDGGLITVSDDRRAERLRILRNHGQSPKYHNRLVGGNFRLDAIQAAVLRVLLPHLDTWTSRRQANAAAYRQLFATAGLSPRIRIPEELPDRRHVYNQFVVRCERRDALLTFLKARGIGCEVYYPVPLHLQPCFRSLGGKPGLFPVAEQAAQDSLALPIYPELTLEMQNAVVSAISAFYS